MDGNTFGDVLLLRVLLVAEAAIGMSARDQTLGILLIEAATLGLDIRTDGAADIWTFVVLQAALRHGLIDHIDSALNETALIGVLNPKDKLAAVMAGNQIRIKRGAQIADVHVARGARRKTRAHFAGGNAAFHLFKPGFFFHIGSSIGSSVHINTVYILLNPTEIVKRNQPSVPIRSIARSTRDRSASSSPV